MKRKTIAIAFVSLSAAGLAFGYHFLEIRLAQKKKSPLIATSRPHQEASPPISTDTQPEGASTASRRAIEQLLEQVIADAIQSGRLNIATLTPSQRASLPDKFKIDLAARATPAMTEDNVLTEDEQEEIEMRAAANMPPPEPQKPDCPEPGHLPESWNNEYNKSILRARGCTL